MKKLSISGKANLKLTRVTIVDLQKVNGGVVATEASARCASGIITTPPGDLLRY